MTWSMFPGLYFGRLPGLSRPNSRIRTIAAITIKTMIVNCRPYIMTPLVQYSLQTCGVTPSAVATALKTGASKSE